MLIGHSDDNGDEDVVLSVTLHHNWFQQNTRAPRVRFGRVHSYNNCFDGMDTAVASHQHSRVVVENSFFHDCKCTTLISTEGELVLRGNAFVQVDYDVVSGSNGDAFAPADIYDYVLDETFLVPGLVNDSGHAIMAKAGSGKGYKVT